MDSNFTSPSVKQATLWWGDGGSPLLTSRYPRMQTCYMKLMRACVGERLAWFQGASPSPSRTDDYFLHLPMGILLAPPSQPSHFWLLLPSFHPSRYQKVTLFPAKLTPLWISFANTRGSPLGSQRPLLFSLKKPISWHPIFSLIHLTWGVSSTYLKHTVLVKENHEDRSESKLWNSFLSLPSM